MFWCEHGEVNPDEELGRSAKPFPNYPAPGRPEQPMRQPESASGWIIGGLAVTFIGMFAMAALWIIIWGKP